MGDETLFRQSPGYLKPTGKFLSISGGYGRMIKSKIPVILGGTPRSFSLVMNSPSGALAKEVVGWVEKEWIKEVPIDSTYAMEDVLEVKTTFTHRLAFVDFPC